MKQTITYKFVCAEFKSSVFLFVHGNVMTVRTSDVITAFCSGVRTDMMVARPSPAHHINHAHVHVHVHASY